MRPSVQDRMRPSILQQPRTSIQKASARVLVRRVNAEVSAVGSMIDNELNEETYRKKMEKLTALAALFERDPDDEDVKREYMALLKEQYGEEDTRMSVHDIEYMSKSYKRHHSQSPPPNHLYPYDRQMPNLATVKHKYRVPSPPQHAIRIKRNSVGPYGDETAEKRVQRQVIYNSKGSQCELLSPEMNAAMQIVVNDRKMQVGAQTNTNDDYNVTMFQKSKQETIESDCTSFRTKKDTPTQVAQIQSPKYQAKKSVQVEGDNLNQESYEAILYPSMENQNGSPSRDARTSLYKKTPFLPKVGMNKSPQRHGLQQRSQSNSSAEPLNLSIDAAKKHIYDKSPEKGTFPKVNKNPTMSRKYRNDDMPTETGEYSFKKESVMLEIKGIRGGQQSSSRHIETQLDSQRPQTQSEVTSNKNLSQDR